MVRDLPVTAQHLVGREAELGAIIRVLDGLEPLPGVVVLPGEAGIGKTALWLAGIDAAAAHGYRVLSARPSEAETRFSFAGLADLLGAAAGAVLPELPPIQRRALEAALLLADAQSDIDDRAVAAALLGALRLLAGGTPLCLAVDDVQWLDAPSLAALRYALARLGGTPVAVLLAVRGSVPDWLRRAVPEGRLRTVDVGGLSVGALQQLLRDRLDATFPRPTLLKLWQTSGGNPFFALELAAALQRSGGTLAPGEALPIPSTLDDLLHERLNRLSTAAIDAACAVAALADPTVALVEGAVGSGVDAGLAEALAARVLEVDRERLRFTHPLLGSAVSARQAPARRRALHARLATLVPTAEERARHLALATAEASGEVASILEDAARSAQARGAPAAAAELAEQALRLTPPANGEDARRRLLIAADWHHAAGDRGRALALLTRARDAAAPGVARATVLVHLAGILQDKPHDAVALYRAALAEAAGDAALEATIHLTLALLLRVSDGAKRGIEHGRLAVWAAARTGDAALRCRALAAYGLLRFHGGYGVPTTEMAEALALERSLAEWPLDYGPTRVFGHQLWWSGEVDRAREVYQEIGDAPNARNHPRAEAETLFQSTWIEWRAGNWDAADRYASEMLELLTLLGRLTPRHQLPAAVIAAHRGRIQEARERAAGALAVAEGEGVRIAQSGHTWVLGFIELSLGNARAALALLRRAHAVRNGTLMSEPGMRVELGDLLEALIAAGELDEAGDILDTWEARATALDRAWALAILARCRALLLAARGDLAGSFAIFERALAEHARTMDPFHHARTLLAQGRTQRRAKRRGAARATLGDALARFERLGAPLWAAQARAELARISGRAPARGGLTEAERRMAQLVAGGNTNREVAAALFLTEHTVETALTRVYRKLGVRSRAGLAHLLAAQR